MLFETDAISTPTMPLSLYQNHPNPCNPSTTIQYYLPDHGRVTLDIYDVSGRRVARLVESDLPKGTHSVEWPGRDQRGAEVSSGVYVYQLKVGRQILSRKMIVLR